MTTQTQAADRHTVVTTGWTNPANAYATSGDNVYATATPAKNQTVDGDFGFPSLGLPADAVVSAVRIVVEWGMTAVVTGGTLGLQGRNNGVADSGAEVTKTTTAEAQSTKTFATLPSVSDLNTAGRVVGRVRCSKGNTNTAMTGNLDFVVLEVDYVRSISPTGGITPTGAEAPVTTKRVAGAITPTGTEAAQARRGLAGAITPVGNVAERPAMRTAGAVAPGGALVTSKLASASIAGAVAPAGVLGLRVVAAVAGSVAPSGLALEAARLRLAGATAPAGTLLEQARRTLDGTITPVGAGTERTMVRLAGGDAPTGTVANTKQASGQSIALTGAIAPVGTTVVQPRFRLAGIVGSLGALVAQAVSGVAGGGPHSLLVTVRRMGHGVLSMTRSRR